jgi:site-specific DNA recombinase
MSTKQVLRCAIYTRKSSEEGLEQDFNSLHAQREACEAYITSQRHEGWVLHRDHYDDGGFSGGNIERPGLKKLLEDIAARKINIVIVYKVDRLTRSLADFAKIIEQFDQQGVSFVSVTQQFNTTSSMGRLTLNVLLSFAQFEREVTGERIRDKIAASKQKGMWMGGPVPLGYEVKDRKLLIKYPEAETVRHIYRRYVELGCVRLLQKDITERDIRSVSGNILSRGTLYKLLSNPIYIGQIRHKDICHTGQHEAIIDQALWDQVQQHMAGNRIGNKTHSRKTDPSPLAGKLFDVSGERLVPIHANKKGRRYRYYISQSLTTNSKDAASSGWRLPGPEMDKTITQAVLTILHDQDAIATALRDAGVASQHLLAAFKTARDADTGTIIEKFVDRTELRPDGIHLILSLASLVPVKNTPIKITRDILMQMKRRGVEMRLVIGSDSPSRVDPALIKAIVRARGWFNELVSGRATTLTQIARRDGIDLGSLSRLLNITFLAPSIIESIMAGHQPADLTVEKLAKRVDLPLDWAEQKHLLGLA